MFEKKLISENILNKQEIKKIKDDIKFEISEAISFAESSPWPNVEDTSKFMFS